MLPCFCNSRCPFRRASRLVCILIVRQFVICSFKGPAFSLYLGDIKTAGFQVGESQYSFQAADRIALFFPAHRVFLYEQESDDHHTMAPALIQPAQPAFCSNPCRRTPALRQIPLQGQCKKLPCTVRAGMEHMLLYSKSRPSLPLPSA